MSKFNIVIKLILPLIIGLFLISSISIFSFYYLLERNIEKQSYQSFKNLNLTLNHAIKQDTKLMTELIQQLQKDEYSIQLYKNKNRDWLFMYLFQTFSELKSHYGLTHFYIHKIDMQNFIRIHNKDHHSDLINRQTLKLAKENFSISSGIEFGVKHNLTLRVVSPWFVNGELIGFIELGKEIDKFTPKLSKLLNADIVFTIDKKLIKPKEFDLWKNRFEHNRFYKSMHNYYIMDSTINIIDSELESFLDKINIQPSTELENNEKIYYINSKKIFDVDNKYLGKIHVLVDSSEEHEFLYDLIIKITIIAFVVSLLIITYYVRYIKDTEYKLNSAYFKIQKMAKIDSMTGLFNKNYYLIEATNQIRRTSRNRKYVTFILLDVDNFKKYNDNYGHLKGDDVLKEIAVCMKKTFKRVSDFCYRVGGEEFLIVIEDQIKENSFKRAKFLCKEIEKLNIPHEYNNEYKSITISIGVYSIRSSPSIQRDTCYDNADKALYQAKTNGRNQVRLFKQESIK